MPYFSYLFFLNKSSKYFLNFTIRVERFPEIEIMAKYHQLLIFIRGIGAQVKNTVMRRKNFLPQISERAPIRGAERKESSPLIPMIRPFMRKVWSGKVSFSTVIMGDVRRPQAKNSRKMTTRAW